MLAILIYLADKLTASSYQSICFWLVLMDVTPSLI